MVGISSSNLPPGFRFHPTDEELIVHYLQNQARSKPCPVSLIPEIDIYKFDPWELPEKAELGENEWYFFSHRDRKYPNGVRPNRAAVSGYWKATGTDKAIYSGSKYVGVKKALVFYKGRPPKGIKSDWIMHEYRLNESRSQTNNQNGSMRLDDVVLCRIYKKKNLGRNIEQSAEDSFPQIVTPHDATEPQDYKFPRTFSINHMWEFDCMKSMSQLLNENNPYNVHFTNQDTSRDHESLSRGVDKFEPLGQVHQQYADAGKFQMNQQMFVNPVYEMQ